MIKENKILGAKPTKEEWKRAYKKVNLLYTKQIRKNTILKKQLGN